MCSPRTQLIIVLMCVSLCFSPCLLAYCCIDRRLSHFNKRYLLKAERQLSRKPRFSFVWTEKPSSSCVCCCAGGSQQMDHVHSVRVVLEEATVPTGRTFNVVSLLPGVCTRASAIADKPPDACARHAVLTKAAFWWMTAITARIFQRLSTPLLFDARYRVQIWHVKTRMVGLQSGKGRMMIDSVVWAQHINQST